MIRGWCPTVFEPMQSGDGLLVRVKPSAGLLSAGAARQLAAAASRHGNGAIELTRAANLQIRGLSPDSAAAFADAMLAAGLAVRDAGAERRRNVIAAPLGAPLDMVEAVEAALADPSLAELPGKFCVAVDGGDPPTIEGVRADIVLRGESGAWCVAIDGGAHAAEVAAAQAGTVVRALARAFLDMRAPGVRRMRGLVESVDDSTVLAAAVLEAPIRKSPSLRGGGENEVGALRHQAAFGIGLPFGQMTAAMLARLADHAETFGDGLLRLSPWRTILIAGVADPACLGRLVLSDGLIADPHDPLLAAFACVGRPGCASASVDARGDALRLIEAGIRGPLHVSGCAKGCAHPAAAAITLVGDGGGYALVRDGAAGDRPVAVARPLDEIVDLVQPVAA